MVSVQSDGANVCPLAANGMDVRAVVESGKTMKCFIVVEVNMPDEAASALSNSQINTATWIVRDVLPKEYALKNQETGKKYPVKVQVVSAFHA